MIKIHTMRKKQAVINAIKVIGNLFNRTISFNVAVCAVILLCGIVIIFHFLVLLQIIPFENVWAGKLKSVDEMYVYESISIAVNCLLIFIILLKGRIIHPNISPKVINTFLWIFVILFIVNTLGNLASKTSLETIIATPLTFILALLCLRVVLANKSGRHLKRLK
jgi:hypothetical protein